jgi:hypothetical protein
VTVEDLTRAAALAYTAITGGAVAFQVGLALGAPWGLYAMGGRFAGVFPPRLRAAAVVQAVVLVLLAITVLSAAGLAAAGLVETLPWLVWVPVVFSAVSLVLNAITPSAGERRIWVPVALALLATSLVVAV